MTISVCIASRGRPELLRQTVATLIAGAALPDTRIVIALDDDDDFTGYSAQLDESANIPPYRVIVSLDQREDSLGAKYNRAQKAWAADLYLLWADDMTMPEAGWDARLEIAAKRIPDQCGAVLFGSIPGILQPGVAVTHKLVEAMGGLALDWTPGWWNETAILEIVSMAQRAVHADIVVELLQDVRGTTQSVRELTFWAELYDKLRPHRVEIAKKVIMDGPDLPEIKEALIRYIPTIARQWEASNSILRDPVQAARLEEYYGGKDRAPPDERYMRLKERAVKMMGEMQ